MLEEEKLAGVAGRSEKAEEALKDMQRSGRKSGGERTGDSSAIIKKTKGEVERLRKRYNERKNEWGNKLHTEMKRRGELLRISETKFESLVKREMRHGRGR